MLGKRAHKKCKYVKSANASEIILNAQSSVSAKRNLLLNKYQLSALLKYVLFRYTLTFGVPKKVMYNH